MNSDTIRKCQDGDGEAQKRIYKYFKNRIYTFCLLHVNDQDDAEDLTQEIFLKIFRAISKYKEGNFSAWVYRIAMNHILNSVTRKRYFENIQDKNITTTQKDIDQSIEIERVLNRMPGRLSLLLILREKEGFNYRELSEIFRVPMGTISSRLAKAREIFRKYYGGKSE